MSFNLYKVESNPKYIFVRIGEREGRTYVIRLDATTLSFLGPWLLSTQLFEESYRLVPDVTTERLDDVLSEMLRCTSLAKFEVARSFFNEMFGRDTTDDMLRMYHETLDIALTDRLEHHDVCIIQQAIIVMTQVHQMTNPCNLEYLYKRALHMEATRRFLAKKATIIQRIWRHVVTAPDHAICLSRLRREWQEMIMEACH